MARAYSKFLKVIFYIFSAYHIIPYFLKITTGLYDNFYSSSISFDLDTLFVNWNTTFPAVTVCEIYNGERIWDIAEVYFKPDSNGEHNLLLDDFVGEVVFNRGICTTCDLCSDPLKTPVKHELYVNISSTTESASLSTSTTPMYDSEYENTTYIERFQNYQLEIDHDKLQCPTNFTELSILFRSSCKELLKNCFYGETEFNCCEVFNAISTEYGQCYAFNSKQARRIEQVEYVSNRETGVGHLVFETSSDVQVHIHPPVEVPFLYSEGMIRETVLLGKSKEIILNIMEVYNHVSVTRLSLYERRCRFSQERTDWGEKLDIYAFYSFSTCVIECTLALQLEVCDCASHFLVSAKASTKVPVCDSRGLSCLTSHLQDLLEARKSCDCMSSCEEPEYDIVFNSADEDTDENENTTTIKIALAELPSQRYVRRVTKDFLDLLISVGGLVGLFFNMSFIRVVEYLFLLRELKWRTLWHRFFN